VAAGVIMKNIHRYGGSPATYHAQGYIDWAHSCGTAAAKR
jgi:hypothetical protein